MAGRDHGLVAAIASRPPKIRALMCDDHKSSEAPIENRLATTTPAGRYQSRAQVITANFFLRAAVAAHKEVTPSPLDGGQQAKSLWGHGLNTTIDHCPCESLAAMCKRCASRRQRLYANSRRRWVEDPENGLVPYPRQRWRQRDRIKPEPGAIDAAEPEEG